MICFDYYASASVVFTSTTMLVSEYFVAAIKCPSWLSRTWQLSTMEKTRGLSVNGTKWSNVGEGGPFQTES